MIPPPHIYTLTGNLLAERTMDFTSWEPGGTHRARGESFQVGGKGINVSRMLHRLGAPNTALAFAGGAPGEECAAWLARRALPHRLFPCETPTRVGLVVRTTPDSPAPRRETTFLGPDAPPDAHAVLACAEFIDSIPSGQVLAICGSLPGWATPRFDPLRAALGRWSSRGHLAVDCYGPALAWLAPLPLALVKINAAEARSIAEEGRTDPLAAAARCVITDGPASVSLREGDERHTLTPPTVVEISPTGSGDVLFACLLREVFLRGRTLRDAVAFGLPYAAANAAHPGIAEFPDPMLS